MNKCVFETFCYYKTDKSECSKYIKSCKWLLKGDKIMKLNETIEMMNSTEYKERFRAEYIQLKIRMEGLRVMLIKYKNGQLNFTPSCSYDLLNGQLKTMVMYAEYLEERAKIEHIMIFS